MHVACACVSLLRDGRTVSGFVIEEVGCRLEVFLETGEKIFIRAPKYVETPLQGSHRKQGHYVGGGGQGITLASYWPVRVSLSKMGRVRFLFPRVRINQEGKMARAM